MLALEGIKILDLSRGYPGAFGTWLLGDLGADVTNIEAPTGARKQQALQTQSSIEEERRRAAYDSCNRNKKSIWLNLRSENGRHIFHQLAEKADVIVDGFRPGVVKRLGIDYPTISKINPKIIYCSMSGYGQDGPYSEMPGHDLNYIAMGGALNLIGDSDGKPVIPLNLVADVAAAGLYGTIGILSALIARGKTGRGQFIDISYTDGVLSMLAFRVTAPYFQDGIIQKRGETTLSGAYPYYDVYEAKDGKFITIGCIEPWLWENLCREIGKEEFIPFHFEWEHFSCPPQDGKWQEISSQLKQIFLTKTRDEWFELLSQKNIPIGKVYSLDEIFTDPQVLHRKMVIEVEHPTEGKIKQVGIAIKLSDTQGKVRSPSPMSGEHTEEILADLGYNKQRINELRQEGTIS